LEATLFFADNDCGDISRGAEAMSELRAVIYIATILALPVALGGCPVAIVGGLAAAGGTGYAANQERGAAGAFDDLTIKTNIQNAWLQVNPLMQRDFTITVYEGRTLLTGMSPNPELKAQAAQVASQIPGVRAIYNEIEVAPTEGAWASVKDTWISSQIRSNLVFAAQVRSVNYTVDTVNGSVYLIGSARSQAELERVTETARNVPNVKRVVSYVEVRPGAPVAMQPGMQPGAPPAPASAQVPAEPPAAAPATAVEVNKL
jgi:osmotically-inducible protein OsmY